MTVQEHAGNEKSCVWHATDFADGELKDELFCIRFGSIESMFALTNEISFKCFGCMWYGLIELFVDLNVVLNDANTCLMIWIAFALTDEITLKGFGCMWYGLIELFVDLNVVVNDSNTCLIFFGDQCTSIVVKKFVKIYRMDLEYTCVVKPEG